jgi:hypothetical protein
MTDEPVVREPSRTPATRSGRFKPHEIGLADDGRLVLGRDGSIEHIDAHSARVHRWEPDDPGWPDQAIRFGLHPQARTITPQGRSVQGSKPPRR